MYVLFICIPVHLRDNAIRPAFFVGEFVVHMWNYLYKFLVSGASAVEQVAPTLHRCYKNSSGNRSAVQCTVQGSSLRRAMWYIKLPLGHSLG